MMEHGEITTQKITRNAWVAKTKIWRDDKPEMKFDLEVFGKTEQEAIDKLKTNLKAKP